MSDTIIESEKKYGNMYKSTRGLLKAKMEQMTAEEIVGAIHHLASDKGGHVLVYDKMCFLEWKMKEIKRFANYLERKKPGCFM